MNSNFSVQVGRAARDLGLKPRIAPTYRGMSFDGLVTRRELNRLRLTLVSPTGWAKGTFKVLQFRHQGAECTTWGAVRLLQGYKDTFAVYRTTSG